jgi:large-conductance mechanosensitive channel
MLKEFKEFAMRGNVVDMAVGIIIRYHHAANWPAVRQC